MAAAKDEITVDTARNADPERLVDDEEPLSPDQLSKLRSRTLGTYVIPWRD